MGTAGANNGPFTKGASMHPGFCESIIHVGEQPADFCVVTPFKTLAKYAEETAHQLNMRTCIAVSKFDNDVEVALHILNSEKIKLLATRGHALHILRNSTSIPILSIEYSAENFFETLLPFQNSNMRVGHLCFPGQGIKGVINGVECLTSNQLYRNGILFTVGDKLPYFANVSESFGIDNELDSVAAFFDKFNVYEFNASQSVPGEIVDGKTVYLDSVMNLSNVMFNELGLINREDSNYWMVVPVDKEWKRLYEEYRTYYNYDNTVPKRDSMQDIMAHKAILQGAIFNMNQQPSPQDSLLSTTYSKWNYRYYKCLSPYAPGGVLDGVSETTCSNGRMFKTDQWNIDKRTTFFQEIKIEAENSFYQDSVAKCKEPVSIRSVATTNPFYGKVSGNTFVEIEPLNIIVTPLIRYTIPNVLSNIGYDIYAVFAPATAADTLATDTLPLRVEFSIQYNDQDGRLVNPIDMVNDEGSKVYETRPDRVDTILVASDYKIPTCSYNTNEPQVRLTVEANRGSATQYTRTLRLDCIILKPHEEDETGTPNE